MLQYLSTFGPYLLDQAIAVFSVTLNCVALMVCYFFFKRFKRTNIPFEEHIAVFKNFAEFLSASVCFIYGLVHLDIFYLVMGAIGIFVGFLIRTLLYFHHRKPRNNGLTGVTAVTILLYIMLVYLSSSAFYAIALKSGTIDCLSGIVTCVLPLMALSDSIRYRADGSIILPTLVDLIAVTILCLHCSHVSLKCLLIVPNLVGLLLISIDVISMQVSRLANNYFPIKDE